jgi:phosphoribosyl-dephospho-CoA transferase
LAPEGLRRHAFVRLAEGAWQRAVAESGDIGTLQEWLAHGRPLIVRRPCVSQDGREVSLGLALPGKRRLAYRVAVDDLDSVELPPFWNGEGFPGFRPRLFGSHAWQELTGLPYVTANSDIDLFIDIASTIEWQEFLSLGEDPGAESRVRLDVEVIFRGDASFSWREYLGPAENILIKSNHAVWLEPKDSLENLLG